MKNNILFIIFCFVCLCFIGVMASIKLQEREQIRKYEQEQIPSEPRKEKRTKDTLQLNYT